jgi:DNA-binding transcriptional LysR family regulator
VDVRRLRLFVALADTLSFRATAERMHLSQPAVTRALASFEAEIGVKLFHRDRRHVAITAEGADRWSGPAS